MTKRQAAILELLQRPDEDGLRRSFQMKQEGKAERFHLMATLPCIHRTLRLGDRDKDKLQD